MTKCSVFGETGVTGEKKPIEFCKYLSGEENGRLEVERSLTPSEWDNITLLYSRNGYDYMYCWDDREEQEGYIYQGHWNDGFVE